MDVVMDVLDIGQAVQLLVIVSQPKLVLHIIVEIALVM